MILLLVSLFFLVVVAFLGCHKDPIEFGNVGVLNINLQRGYKTMNKGALESFDARVTIYYSEKDTVSYNCRFTDTDGDGRYTNDPSVLDNIYVRREVGFWVGVLAVIQGDTVTGMTDPTNLLYLPEENPILDVNIVLVAVYPRIVVSTSTEVVGEDILIFGEVLEGGEMLEEYGFAIRRGQLGDDEKRLWASRVLTERDMENLYSYGDYQFFDAEILETGTNRFGCALEMMDFDSVEYSVAAIAWLREGVDSLMAFVHSPVVTMTISGGGAIIEEFAVYTESATEITESSATLNGYVTYTDGVEYCGFILDMGTYNDTLMVQPTADGYFSYQASNLTPSTTYSYQAFANRNGWVFGQEVSFTTSRATTGTLNGHTWVDLGLPSGLLWATTNIGAEDPEDYGNYYAWGETETKETYDTTTYRYYNGSPTALTKYCNNESYGNEGYTDTLTILEADDDAATANWGSDWRMPTQSEIQELIDNCDTTMIDNGMLFTSRNNGNSIYLPAAGEYIGNEFFINAGGYFWHYWSSSLCTDTPDGAWILSIASSGYGLYYHSRIEYGYRDYGRPVRAVCFPSKKKRK